MPKIGFCYVSTRDTGIAPPNSWPLFRAWQKRAGFQIMKVHLPTWATTDPLDVKEAVWDGVSEVIVRTGDVPDGYDQQAVRARLDAVNGSGLRWRDVLAEAAARGVTVWIEVGNEPDHGGWSAERARDATIALVQALRPVYPWAKWLASLPTRSSFLASFLSPALLSTVDGVATHLYGGSWPGDAAGGDWGPIFDTLMSRADVTTVYVTEIGIEARDMDKEEKALRLFEWASRAPRKVKGILVFTAGAVGKWPQWDGYVFPEEKHFLILSGLRGKVMPRDPSWPVSPVTGKAVYPPFQQYWNQNGGLYQFGYPVTDPCQEVIRGCQCRADGSRHVVQYFERAVFEQHSGIMPSTGGILLRRLGAESAEQRGYLP